MSERKHALLSASNSHKWLHCTPSARLEDSLPESESTYANEGRLAHEIAELKLRKQFIEPMSSREFNKQLKKLQENELYQPEMLNYIQTYIDFISEIVHSFGSTPYITIEKKIDYSMYAPEGFGTGDCIIIHGDTLYVIDLKYGKGVPVSAENNSQMMLYALGAAQEYYFLYGISTVRMSIVQPRLDSISTYTLNLTELLEWGQDIVPIAEKAFAGEGEFNPGDHCRFCRARQLCRARSEFNMELTTYEMKKPPLLTNEDVGSILIKAQELASWVKDLEEYALAEILKGEDIPGWKAVEGRSVRSFTDQDEAFKVLLANGTEEAMLYERKPLTLAKIEDLIGKKTFKDLLASYVTVPPGKPTLALLGDKREAIKKTTAQDDFSSVAPE
jgi:hypothetical protein